MSIPLYASKLDTGTMIEGAEIHSMSQKNTQFHFLIRNFINDDHLTRIRI